MPRALDVDQRREQITDAAIRLLARHGSTGLTIKALAREIGGSTTRITHLYPRKADLFEGILVGFERRIDAQLAAMQPGLDHVSNLRDFLDWCMPSSEAEINDEQLRLALLEHAAEDPRVRALLNRLEERMRDLLRRYLVPLVAHDRIEASVWLFTAATNGGTLKVFEHPATWTRERRLAVIDHLIAATVRGQDVMSS